ncbi:N(4)-(beta-N-acetylglucosaminyl)-L-asparaginase [Aquirufa sp. HETE-83D]|uniref:N(4)-(Beta-N-acetylglucosaminyl)-L-asparaginase n=1 Tax=Aquirufa esocilacus TaxID=3096513 RepID=A0ABW6DHE9_9BACT
MKRRTFLQTSTLLGASLSATAQSKTSEPLIIATWKNEKATIAGWNKLMETGKALDGVEAGARIPEADPNDTSVGYGGYPDRDGHVTLDACIMDHLGNAGSVTFLEGIMHPISVARAVMEKTPHVMLSGAGALKFALDQGFKVENLLTETSKKAWEEWKKESKYEPVINIERHDTIGLLGIGKSGEIAGACTTSGLAFKMHGRVGDSPIIGGAVFCDDEVGGACATGLGEFVMKTLGSFLIVELMRQGMSPQKACEEAVMRIVKRYKYKEFQIGYLALNKKGEYGAYAIQKGFNYTITKNGKTQVIESGSYM